MENGHWEITSRNGKFPREIRKLEEREPAGAVTSTLSRLDLGLAATASSPYSYWVGKVASFPTELIRFHFFP